MTHFISSPNGINIVSYETWMAAIASSACIGFTSLVPWLFNLTFFEKDKCLKSSEANGEKGTNGRMKYLLSFAVGAILGDIFFHLIPESYQNHLNDQHDSTEEIHKKVGLSIIAGIFMFIIVDTMLEKWSNTDRNTEQNVVNDILSSKLNQKVKLNTCENDPIQIFKDNIKPDLIKKKSSNIVRKGEIGNQTQDMQSYKTDNNNNVRLRNFNQSAQVKREGMIQDINNNSVPDAISASLKLRKHETKSTPIEPIVESTILAPMITSSLSVDSAGYLNLIANGFDNFTHGLAIGASFLVGLKVGFLTTFVIIVHEIPHEICDYAILVNSGFSRWEAVKAQSSVSLFGIIGTATALYVKSIETLNAKTVWILPFSAGSFLYIALVNLLPEILDRKTELRDTLGQVFCVIVGVSFMALVAIF